MDKCILQVFSSMTLRVSLSPVMDSPTDLFSDSALHSPAFAPSLSSTDLPGVHPQPSAGRPPPAFRPPGFSLVHHLHQPGGSSKRGSGQPNVTNMSSRMHLDPRNLEENGVKRDEQLEQPIAGGEEGILEGEESLSEGKKRHSDSALSAEWGQDVLKVKRMKTDRHRDEEGGRRRESGKDVRRREREELKEQLEEARERLQLLQEKVWRAFGEKHLADEEKNRRNRSEKRGTTEDGHVDAVILGEEDIPEGMYDEEDMDDGELEKESFSLLSVSPFDHFHKGREERQKEREKKTERDGGLHLESLMEGSGLWLDCGGLVRGDWDGEIEEEGEEGGQKFAQALKLELGSAVARVIDRVLRLYTETTDLTPSSPPPAISFLQSSGGNEGGRGKDMWMGLLTSGQGEDKTKGKEKVRGQDGGLQLQKNGTNVSAGESHPTEPSDLSMPLAVQRSPDLRKSHPLLGPPPPNLSLHHPSLPHPPPLSHPPLLPPTSQPKDTSSSSSSSHPSSSSSSASSSFPAPLSLHPPPPPPPPPLPLPLLHYSMQQLFSRALHHPQLPHLPPPRKDYLNPDSFLDFSPHPTSHPSFPPLPLLGHLDPSLAHHAHRARERERGVRGGGGAMDGGDLYLAAGGISF